MTDITDGPDVVAQLLLQHRTIRSLLAAVGNATPAERAAQLRPLVRLLAVHETAEEVVVYPALVRGAGDEGSRIADARKAEEDEAKRVLAELEEVEPASAEFDRLFEPFSAAVQDHAAAEEREVFPLLARITSAEELRGLGAQLRTAEGLAPTHGHRSAPESAAGNVLAGPFLGMVDRVRDLFHDLASPNQ